MYETASPVVNPWTVLSKTSPRERSPELPPAPIFSSYLPVPTPDIFTKDKPRHLYFTQYYLNLANQGRNKDYAVGLWNPSMKNTWVSVCVRNPPSHLSHLPGQAEMLPFTWGSHWSTFFSRQNQSFTPVYSHEDAVAHLSKLGST